MSKRGIKKQLDLIFEDDRISDIFADLQPLIKKCHKLQDAKKSTSGNCFYWWRNRYSEYIQEIRAKLTTDEYIKTDKLFPQIWQKYESEFTRRPAKGVPNAAYE